MSPGSSTTTHFPLVPHRLLRGLRAFAAMTSALLLALALSGCLVSDELVDLGPRVQPLEPGLYASFDKDGAPDHAVVMRKSKDGRYLSEEFNLAFYASGLAPDIYFIAYVDKKKDQTLYGLGRVEADALIYPGVVCSMIPAEARRAAALGDHEEGCHVATPEQGRAALSAVWRVLQSRNDKPARDWTRFVRQTEFNR